MEFRKLPHGQENISVIGLGMSAIHLAPDKEAAAAIDCALEGGINFFDLCCGRIGAYKTFGQRVADCRDRVYTQMHFGAVYNEKGEYGFGRDFEQIKRSFETALEAGKLSYTDFGYIHCIDELADYERVMQDGLFDYVRTLQAQGVVRHIGFSTHTPVIARRFIDDVSIDLFMFSINPAYDCATGTYAYGSVAERQALYRTAKEKGIGISVMKTFAGGQLLDARTSPLGAALSHYQCIQYALDQPGVVCCLPGVRNSADVRQALGFFDAMRDERDYSVLKTLEPVSAEGRCVYCSHCAPCPVGIDVGLVNKYYDLTRVGDDIARDHYERLYVRAGACIGCGHCERRCPFGVKQVARMQEIKAYFEGSV